MTIRERAGFLMRRFEDSRRARTLALYFLADAVRMARQYQALAELRSSPPAARVLAGERARLWWSAAWAFADVRLS